MSELASTPTSDDLERRLSDFATLGEALDYAARGKTSLFRGFSLWAGTLLSAFIGKDEDMDRWKLGSVVWWAMKHRGWIWKLGASIFQGRLKKKVAGGLKEVYNRYYQSSEHPIVKFTE